MRRRWRIGGFEPFDEVWMRLMAQIHVFVHGDNPFFIVIILMPIGEQEVVEGTSPYMKGDEMWFVYMMTLCGKA